MKKLLICLIALLIITGCSSNETTVQAEAPKRFEIIEEIESCCVDYYVLVDKETGVCYLQSVYSSYNKGGVSVTPLYNADGTLMVVEVKE